MSPEPRQFLWLNGNESGPVRLCDHLDDFLEETYRLLVENQFRGGTSRFAAVDEPEAL